MAANSSGNSAQRQAQDIGCGTGEIYKEKRKQICQQLQNILADDRPTAFIAFGNTLYAVSDKLTGIKPRSALLTSTAGITCELRWDVEKWNKQ